MFHWLRSAREANLRRENAQKTRRAADQLFPNERWVNAASIKLAQKGPDFEIPDGIDNIKVAKSRLTPSKNRSSISDNDARTLAKEIRQAKVLIDKNTSIFILPKMKAADGSYIHGPDALVNGTLYEFKTVTGSIKRLETRFRESREQGRNVFIRVMNPGISKSDILAKIKMILNDPSYKGGTKGSLVFHLSQTQRTYFMRIKDLK